MSCPRCGSTMEGGVCPACGFPNGAFMNIYLMIRGSREEEDV